MTLLALGLLAAIGASSQALPGESVNGRGRAAAAAATPTAGTPTQSPPNVQLFAEQPTHLQDTPQLTVPAARSRSLPATTAWFLAGAAGAFVAHETGHVFANLVAGNVPRLVGLRGFGFVPFFAISPAITCRRGACTGARGQPFPQGTRGSYTIASAGFEVQHFGNELILGRTPELRHRHAPMQKGWLTFNVALSVGYAVASLAHVEDVHGDAGGAAYYARVPRGVVAAMLLIPAALDTWRYFRPQDNWAPWVSRTGKLGLIGLALRI